MQSTPSSSFESVTWKDQPVFISSTFRDMQAERDMLHDYVFPRLREKLKAYHRTLSPVDLRNGVETVGLEKAEEKELQVLSVCLDEIQRCAPFLIVILGERYGWVPHRERMQEAVRLRKEDEILAGIDIADKSITAIEIEYGSLLSESSLQRTFFFFRELENEQDIPDKDKALYDDRHSTEEETRARHKRLEKLKSDILASDKIENKHIYTAYYDTKQSSVKGLEDWAEMVFQTIWKNLEEECRQEETDQQTRDPFYSSWQSAEKRALQEFLFAKAIGFVAKEKEVDSCLDFILSDPQKQGLLIPGEAGTGKSVLFSRLYTRLEETNRDKKFLMLAHSAGISKRSASLHRVLERWIHEMAIHLNEQDAVLYSHSDFNLVKEKFLELLKLSAASGPVICMMDSLDTMAPSQALQSMNWLPNALPDNARFFFTSTPCRAAKALEIKPWMEIRQIQAFINEESKDKVVHAYLAKQCEILHKNTINEQVIQEITRLQNTEGKHLACANPLWLSIAAKIILNLDARDHQLISESTDSEADDRKILNYQLELTKQLPGDVSSIYNELFSRSAERFGQRLDIPWIEDMLDLIACSRYGLRENDIEALLLNRSEEKKQTKSDFSRQFALVRNYMSGHLVKRDELGLWDYAHKEGRKSRLSRKPGKTEGNEEYFAGMHREIANYLETSGMDDPMFQGEIMWHYYHGNLTWRAGEYYAENENPSASTIIANEIIHWNEDQDKNHIFRWLEEVLFEENDYDENEIWCEKLLKQVYEIVRHQSPVSVQIEFLDLILRCMLTIPEKRKEVDDIVKNKLLNKTELPPTVSQEALDYLLNSRKEQNQHKSKRYRKLMAEVYLKYGSVSIIAGETDSAQSHFLRAEEIYTVLNDEFPDEEDVKLNLSHVNNYLRELSIRSNNIDEARRRSQDLKSSGEFDPDQVSEYDMLSAKSTEYEKIGDLKLYENKFREAEKYYKETFTIRKQLYEKYPDDPVVIHNYSICFGKYAHLFHEKGQYKEAAEYYQAALKLHEKNVELFPENIEYIRSAYASSMNAGNMYGKIFDFKKGLSLYNYTEQLIDFVLSLSPDNLDVLYDKHLLYKKISMLYIDDFKPELSLAYRKKSNEIFDYIDKEFPNFTPFTFKDHRQVEKEEKRINDIKPPEMEEDEDDFEIS